MRIWLINSASTASIEFPGLRNPRRRDHDALFFERAAVGRHASGLAAADVGVVGAAGREAELAPVVAEKIGVTIVMSGRCVPPLNGSLRIQASPGA